MAAMSAREFNQYTGRAKLLAQEEPLFITERGVTKYVLLNIDEYEKTIRPKRSLFEAIKPMSEEDYFEYDFPRLEIAFREVDFSD